MRNYKALAKFMSEKSAIRVCILDNNNTQFCFQNESLFPVDEIYKTYDMILVPEWVLHEISHSEKRLQYVFSIPKPLFILNEESDYLPFVNFEDERLKNVFRHSASPYSRPRKFFKELEKQTRQNAGIIPDDWIVDFYEQGFETKETSQGVTKKNAGEVSILTLAYLLLHKFKGNISQITISSSDRGSLDIKRNIMQHLDKQSLLDLSDRIPVSFLSTDILIIQAYKANRMNEVEIRDIRKNPRSVMYTENHPDGTSAAQQYVLETEGFIEILKNIENINFQF
jgi:hypothetical protein